MTIEAGYVPESYNGNGATTVFSFDFKINQASDLVVTHVDANGAESVLTEGTGTMNYSISVASYPGTGSITYPATLGTELPNGESLVLSRSVTIEQQTDLVNQGAWNPDQVEAAFDYGRMVDQQIYEEITRSLRLPISSSSVSVELPTPTADAVIGWNATADALTNLTPNTEAYLPASTYMKTVLEAATASEARTDLGLGTLATLNAVPDDSITLAKMAGGTDGELITYDSDGNPATVSTGTAAQVLKSNGTGAAPTMQDNDADGVVYDNSTTGFSATDAQAAIDETAQGGTIIKASTQTASGSENEFDFTIPSWAKRITVTVSGLKTGGTNNVIVQLGDSGGIKTSGYNGSVSRSFASSIATGLLTDGFRFSSADVTDAILHGAMTLTLHDGNTWAGVGGAGRSDGATMIVSQGSKALSAALTTVRVTTSTGSPQVFTAGTVSVVYE